MSESQTVVGANKPEPNYVLCARCKKPINVKDFGGIINNNIYRHAFFHKLCLELEMIEGKVNV
jgi:hypothetical protein